MGHIRYLKHAKSLGKHLVVGLIGETENARYPFSQNERAEALNCGIEFNSSVNMMNLTKLSENLSHP